MCRTIFEVRVPIQSIVDVLNAMDRDKDGCISVDEFISVLKAVRKSYKGRAKDSAKEVEND